jgi:glucosamine-6-phosphate deaminase
VELVVLPSPAEVSEAASRMVVETLAARPDAVLGLAAGNTPRPVYADLVRRHRAGELSFSRALAFTLDEYLGLPPGHPASFRAELARELLARVDLPAAAAHAPDAEAPDRAAACARYEAAIAAAGGFDLILLGIGANGHVAFNEPGAPFDSRTRVVTLTEETRAASRAVFGDAPPPREALTIGIATILEARRVVLIATGAGKAAAIAGAVEGPVTERLPASALRRHPNATVIVDGAAASLLTPSRA